MLSVAAVFAASVLSVKWNEMWRDTDHAAIGLTGSKGPDHKRDVQIRVNPPALIATLQTADVIL